MYPMLCCDKKGGNICISNRDLKQWDVLTKAIVKKQRNGVTPKRNRHYIKRILSKKSYCEIEISTNC